MVEDILELLNRITLLFQYHTILLGLRVIRHQKVQLGALALRKVPRHLTKYNWVPGHLEKSKNAIGKQFKRSLIVSHEFLLSQIAKMTQNGISNRNFLGVPEPVQQGITNVCNLLFEQTPGG